MRSVDDIRAALRAHAPQEIAAKRRAAVAVVLHDAAEPSMLFIERAERLGDPWSGQMAFPGGRIDAGDASVRAAAERETREEVGLDLAGADLLGRLDDLHAGVRLVAPLVLSSFVYRLAAAPSALMLNHEVRDAFWVPIRTLLDPDARVTHRWGAIGRFPGICVGHPERHVVWGLTYQLLGRFFEVAGLAP
jgi:8-oxo-dGTP pyrophosphatase MutT (NUDIX family)